MDYNPRTQVLAMQPEFQHFRRKLPAPLSTASLLNDVRPSKSGAMSYWLRFAMTATANPSDAPVQSLHTPLNIVSTDALAQGSVTLMVPLLSDHFTFYLSPMPSSGALGHVYAHTHSVLCQELLLFAATPVRLGLHVTSSALQALGQNGFLTVKESGFTSLGSLRSALLQKSLPICVFKPWPSPDPANLDGVAHSAECSQWLFHVNDPVTTVTLFSVRKELPPSMVNATEYEMHFYWQIYYYSDVPKYTGAFSSSFPGGFEPELSRRDLMRAMMLVLSQQRSINAPVWPAEEAALPLALMVAALMSPVVCLSLLVALLLLLSQTALSLAVVQLGFVYFAASAIWYALRRSDFHGPVRCYPSMLRNTFLVLAFGTVGIAMMSTTLPRAKRVPPMRLL